MPDVDILQSPDNLKEDLEKAKYLIDDLASRLDELGLGGDEKWAELWNALIDLQVGKADAPAAPEGEQAVPAVDQDGDETFDCELADSELSGTPLSYTLDLNDSSEYEWFLYNGLATSFTLEKGEDPAFTKKSWTAGFGIPILNKSASVPASKPVLQWTGVDSEFSSAQNSIEWCPDGQGVDDEYLLQIHNMDNAPGVTYDPETDSWSPVGYSTLDFCVRDVEGGTVDWLEITDLIEYMSDGGLSHLSFGGDSADAHDGEYWHLGGTYNGAEACYGVSVGRGSSNDDQAIDLDNSTLMDASGTPPTANVIALDWANRQLVPSGGTGFTVDWEARTLDGDDWTVLSGTKLLVADIDASTGVGTGAIQVTGGGYFAKGVYSDKGGATRAGYFDDATNNVILCDGTSAANLNGPVNITDAGGGLDIIAGDYYHGGVQGETADDSSYIAGGLMLTKAGKTLKIINGSNLQATDKIAVWR